jgi:hypothetical protein
MNWVKDLITASGLTLVAQITIPRDIRRFTDSQGTLHITKFGPKKRGSPTSSPSLDASRVRSFSPPSPTPPLSGDRPPRSKPQFPSRRRLQPPPHPFLGPVIWKVQLGRGEFGKLVKSFNNDIILPSHFDRQISSRKGRAPGWTPPSI